MDASNTPPTLLSLTREVSLIECEMNLEQCLHLISKLMSLVRLTKMRETGSQTLKSDLSNSVSQAEAVWQCLGRVLTVLSLLSYLASLTPNAATTYGCLTSESLKPAERAKASTSE